jgi:hypothetical protein
MAVMLLMLYCAEPHVGQKSEENQILDYFGLPQD